MYRHFQRLPAIENERLSKTPFFESRFEKTTKIFIDKLLGTLSEWRSEQ